MFKFFRSRTPISLGTTSDHPSETSVLFAIVLAATANGFYPLIVDVAAANVNPFIFNAATSAIHSGFLLLLLKGASRPALGAPRSYREMLRPGIVCLFWDRTRSPATPRSPRKVREWIRTPVLWGVAGNLGFAWFVMASHYVDTAVVVVVFQLWALLALFLLNRLGRLLAVGNQRPHRIAPRHAALAVVAFVGVVFVVLSETAHVDVPSQWASAIIGLGLAFLAAISGSLAPPTSVSMGHLAHAHLRESNATQPNKYQLIWLSVYGMMWIRAFGGVLSLSIGTVSWIFGGGTLGWRAVFGAALISGFSTVAAFLVRWALHSSPNLGSQVGNYVSPAVALALLAVFTDVNVARVDFLLIGAALIVAANVLIRPKPVK